MGRPGDRHQLARRESRAVGSRQTASASRRHSRTSGALTFEVIAVLFLATFIRSTLGFGEALVAVPLLALVIPIKTAAPIAALVSVTVAAAVVVQDWRDIRWRSAARLVVSTLFGIPLGLMLLVRAPEPLVNAVL